MKVSQLEKRDFIILDNNLYQVIDLKHTHLGRGGANVLLVLKELKTGKRLEKNLKSDFEVELAEIEKMPVVYKGKKGDELIFSDGENIYKLRARDCKDIEPYLFLDRKYEGLFLAGNNLITVVLPKIIYAKVISSPPALKGNSVQSTTKFVTLENGFQIKVPLFIKEGEIIAINTETGEYLERANLEK